jgi:hypothetical protein
MNRLVGKPDCTDSYLKGSVMNLNIWYWVMEYPPKYYFAKSLREVIRYDPKLRLIFEKARTQGKDSLTGHEKISYELALWKAGEYAVLYIQDFGLKVVWCIPVIMFFLYFFEIL